MKKNMILWTLVSILPLGAAAQETIRFVASTPAQQGLSQKTTDALKLKTEQIIARNNAGATSIYNAFVIQPELLLGETKETEGLLRDVTLITGEFSLTVRNKYDGSVYGTVVMEVQGDAVGSEEDAITSLISGIKVTDPAFVRFIRNARKRIADFYEQNCSVILKKEQALAAAGRMEEAADYIATVPATAPCHDEITALFPVPQEPVLKESEADDTEEEEENP